LHERTLTDFFSRMSVGYEQGFREFCKVIVDVELQKQKQKETLA
jgi:hypothetical protein